MSERAADASAFHADEIPANSAVTRPGELGRLLQPRRLGMTSIMPTKKWSQAVTEHSDALDLKEHVFELDDPAAIARSLKRSAEHSSRRKAEPYRSAMSMLTFYVNRAGKNLPAKRKRILENAKGELRKLYGRA